nr:importin-9 isoform X1 [Ipomoea batatas]
MDVFCFANELSTFICINNGYLKRKEKVDNPISNLALTKPGDAIGGAVKSVLVPFLYARMFSSIAKFSSVINRGNIQQFLYAAVKAIGMDVYITSNGNLVLETLQATVNWQINQGNIQQFLYAAVKAIGMDVYITRPPSVKASDEAMHLVLETLQATVNAVCEAEGCLQREIEILSPVGEMEQSAPMVSKISGEELIESGSSGRSKGRRRRKKRGFRVGNALQILALDYGDEERLDGSEKWIEDLKEKVGHDEELIRAVDEAYEEVLELFEEALEELGVPGEDMDDELVCKAALIFWKKWEKIIQTSKELREAHAVSKGNERGESSGEQCESVGGEKEGEGACGSDKRRGKEEDAIYEECDIVGEEIGVGFREKEGEEKKYHADCDECSAGSEEEANVEYGDDEYDDVEKDANVEDGEYDEYEFNDDEWLDWLEGKLRYARGVNWMNEVLKEIYSYMQVVYDEQQQVHWEEEGSMALKACIILREVVRVSPMRGCLHPESELGYLLLMNQEIIGRRLCRWAWRRFRRGWEEKLMRLDVNPYCS